MGCDGANEEERGRATKLTEEKEGGIEGVDQGL
jgi:hypothetical protein